MKFSILTTMFLSLTSVFFTVNAQNLVPNGSFEDYTSLPISSGDWPLCVGWNNVNMNLGNWPYATPDYLHTSGIGDAKLPNCKWADVNAQDGDAIMGLYSKHSSQLNSRDYIATQLTSPLVVGTTYTISFWLTSGSGNYYYGSSSENFGVQLTSAPLTQVQHENAGGTPQAIVPGSPWHTGWVFYSFSYVATSAYQYVTVGNFYTDAVTSTTVHYSGANYSGGSYYFVDDLIVESANSLPVELIRFDVINQENSVISVWQTVTETNNDFFTVERSGDAKSWTEVGIVDGAGNSQDLLDYSFRDYSPLAGRSYYRLKQTDFDGETSYSSVKSVVRILEEGTELRVYPNPTRHTVTIEGNYDEIIDFKLLNELGIDVTDQVILLNDDNDTILNLDLSALPGGVYVFKTVNSVKRITKI
ncbi:MAG: hypothetical protein QNK23_10525 [Crocinitomicaceae bacterium]|nr:hypothetical protein [Crocinitomicaceae bacterium]